MTKKIFQPDAAAAMAFLTFDSDKLHKNLPAGGWESVAIKWNPPLQFSTVFGIMKLKKSVSIGRCDNNAAEEWNCIA